MDKVIKIILVSFLFYSACNSKPDVGQEVKSIDSLHELVKVNFTLCESLDTTWVKPITEKSNANIKIIKKVYTNDSVNMEEAQMMNYYKGFRKVGKRFINDRIMFITEFNKSLTQLENLKTDAVNGALKKEDVIKYLNEEKLVTTDLISKFNIFKSSTDNVIKNFDSLNPLIENIIEVYSVKYEERINKGGRTIH